MKLKLYHIDFLELEDGKLKEKPIRKFYASEDVLTVLAKCLEIVNQNPNLVVFAVGTDCEIEETLKHKSR